MSDDDREAKLAAELMYRTLEPVLQAIDAGHTLAAIRDGVIAAMHRCQAVQSMGLAAMLTHSEPS